MFDPLISKPVVVAAALLVLALWAASVAFVFWDVRRRNVSAQHRSYWVLFSLIPFLGIASYLLNRRYQAAPAAPKTRVTVLKPQQSAPRPRPTVAAAEYTGIAELNTHEPARGMDQAPAFGLSVVTGPHQGQELVLNQLPALIGRGADAAVRLDRDLGVSRRHAELYQQQGILRLRDLNSTHGTSVNGSAINDTRLVPGDTIDVGISRLVLKKIGENS